MPKEWPKQNTGLFAPPSCATCCAPEVPLVWERHTSQYTLNGVPQTYPYYMTLVAPSYSLTITPQTRDPVTGIVAVGVMTWEPATFGPLAGTPLECQGCYGYTCVDGDGNPIGGTDGVNGNGPDHAVWEFYYTANLEHGAFDDVVMDPFKIQAYGLNMPTCQDFDGFPETIERTVTW